MPAATRAGPYQNHETGAASRHHMWVAEAQVLALSSAAFPGALVESWVGTGAAGT